METGQEGTSRQQPPRNVLFVFKVDFHCASTNSLSLGTKFMWVILGGAGREEEKYLSGYGSTNNLKTQKRLETKEDRSGIRERRKSAGVKRSGRKLLFWSQRRAETWMTDMMNISSWEGQGKKNTVTKEVVFSPARDHRRALRPAGRRGWPRPRFHPGWNPCPAWEKIHHHVLKRNERMFAHNTNTLQQALQHFWIVKIYFLVKHAEPTYYL